jgi:nucleotide-binding universal stress UspA family protein
MSDTEAAPSPTDADEAAIVLAAIDTSSLATQVVDLAARMTRRTWTRAELHLIHVFKSAPFDRPSSAGLRREELIADAQSQLDYHVRMARRQCPSPVFGHLATGDPANEIIKCSRSLKTDLIILGTHDAMGLDRLLLGSVAVKVAKNAPCSVVIVRRKQRPYQKVPVP